MKSSSPSPKRITLVLRGDLTERALEKAALLHQNPNSFVNLCVEGMLDAMDAPGSYDPPVLELYNRVKGRAFLTSKTVMTLVSAFFPEVQKIDDNEQKFLFELIDKHEGGLTPEIFKGYCKVARRMNMERIAHERELKKIQGKSR